MWNAKHSSLFSRSLLLKCRIPCKIDPICSFQFSNSSHNYIVSGPKEKFKIWGESLGKYLYGCLKRRNPNEVLAIDASSNEVLTCGQHLEKSVKLAIALKKMSIGKGDIVSIVCKNHLNSTIASSAVLYLGAVAQLINFEYTQNELKHTLDITKPKLIFSSELSLQRLLCLNTEQNYVETIISIDGARDTDQHVLSIEALVNKITEDVEHYEPENFDLRDSAMLLLSSGTTGLPKCVNLSHENIFPLINIIEDERYINVTKHDCLVSFLPLYHFYGFAIYLSSITARSKIIFMERFVPDTYLKLIEQHHATKLFVVPSVLLFLVKNEIVNQFNLSSIKSIFVAGAPVGTDLYNAAIARFQVSIRQIYGSTETGAICTVQDVGCKYKSVGVLTPNVSCKVLDLSNHKSVGPSHIGELSFKGVNVMKGYYNNETATRNTFEEDGFYRTGDVGYYNVEGNFFIVDRVKDLIKYKGYQVSPTELEDLISTHSSVKECAVVGIPDERVGEVPTAYVVRNIGANVTEKELVQFVSENISINKQLYGGVRFVDEIPKTPSGKVMRNVLRNGGPGLCDWSITFLLFKISTCGFHRQCGILCGPQEKFKIWYESFGKYLYTCMKERDPNDIITIDAVSRETLTVGDLLEKSVKLSTALKQMPLKKGEVVAIICENIIKYYIAVLATLYCGAITFLINFTYTPRELEHAFKIALPKIILCTSSALPNVLIVKEQLSIVPTIITIDDHDTNYPSIDSLIQTQTGTEDFQIENIDLKDTAFLCLSSGTTGLAKCAKLSHKNLIPLVNVAGDERYVNLSKGDVIVSVVPFFHIYGLCVYSFAIYTSVKVVLIKSFRPEIFLQSIQDLKATKLFLVPPILQFLVKSPLVNNYDITSLKDIMVGAAPLGKDLHEEALLRFKEVSIRQLYGSTESGGLVSIQSRADKTESVGSLISNVQCKLVDLETEKPVGPLQTGEIRIKSIAVIDGYYNDEAETKRSFDADGFYCMGDVGYYTEDGRLFFVDRIKEIIKYKGFQVPPSELEDIIMTHSAVQDCGVVGMPHERAGEVPLAFVVRDKSMNVTEEELIQLVADNVSVSKRLYGGVRFIERIPRTAAGKLLRRELKNLIENV
ncbi:hypothetical protein RI129_003462 [Pyrocoelia pectoralis]|uniref:Luciferin 4-monooxygenase n=1 Tax=Pyrocoelia pectoralis TaxID=417401 RepID=A0AAN7VIA2_9COLE